MRRKKTSHEMNRFTLWDGFFYIQTELNCEEKTYFTTTVNGLCIFCAKFAT